MKIPLKNIKPSPRPVRTSWDEEKLDELARSIDEQGLLVPVKVRPSGKKYEIVYGHRRVEAIRRLDWQETDALVEGMDDTTVIIQALIENVQREDMNAMDKAHALKTIMDEKSWNTRDVERAGLMSNVQAIRLIALLKEPLRIQKKIATQGSTGITERHARASRQTGLKPIDRVRVIEKAEREDLPASTTKKVARVVANEPDPEKRKQILEQPYDAFVQNNHQNSIPLPSEVSDRLLELAEAKREAVRRQAQEASEATSVVRRAPERKANDLDGATWTRHSISVWNDIRKDADELALNHPAMFPAMLAQRLIECFTTADERVVLDPMAGSGSALVAAKKLGKVGIGVELSSEYAALAQERLDNIDGAGQAAIHVGDANDLLSFVDAQTVDFGVTSPPYWDILSQQRTADYKLVRDYSEAEGNLGTVADYREFLTALTNVYSLVYQTLKPGAYFCVVVMDIRKQDRLYPLHADLPWAMQDLGYVYDDLIIWDRRQEYNNLRPLGYPSVFRVNRIHEYILIFRKLEG